ncbi:hypothetical protein C8R43DRAFT_1146727 [Mycena crocata]|nr:hypothetical protein C8R43DRAFT_1146727 [Mycena crocata]
MNTERSTERLTHEGNESVRRGRTNARASGSGGSEAHASARCRDDPALDVRRQDMRVPDREERVRRRGPDASSIRSRTRTENLGALGQPLWGLKMYESDPTVDGPMGHGSAGDVQMSSKARGGILSPGEKDRLTDSVMLQGHCGLGQTLKGTRQNVHGTSRHPTQQNYGRRKARKWGKWITKTSQSWDLLATHSMSSSLQTNNTTLREISRPSSSASDALQYTPPAIVDPAIQASSFALTYDGVVAYLDTAQKELQEQPHVYNAFLDLMNDYRSKRIDKDGVRTRISVLFDDHPALLQQFITLYLPIENPDDVQPSPANVSPLTATPSSDEKDSTLPPHLRYMDLVKTTLQDDPTRFQSFLVAMRLFKSGSVDVPDLMKHVALLFYGYSDLVERFNGFLPAGYTITLFPTGITVATPTGTTVLLPPSLSTADLNLREN